MTSPFRDNAKPPEPPPVEDTSAAWFEKLRADAYRRERVLAIGAVAVPALIAIVVVIGVILLGAAQVDAEQRCSAAGGTYLRGKCLAVKELHL